jgi:hypothetical protein
VRQHFALSHKHLVDLRQETFDLLNVVERQSRIRDQLGPDRASASDVICAVPLGVEQIEGDRRGLGHCNRRDSLDLGCPRRVSNVRRPFPQELSLRHVFALRRRPDELGPDCREVTVLVILLNPGPPQFEPGAAGREGINDLEFVIHRANQHIDDDRAVLWRVPFAGIEPDVLFTEVSQTRADSSVQGFEEARLTGVVLPD